MNWFEKKGLQKISTEIKKAYKRPYGYISWTLTIFLGLIILFIGLREPIMRAYLSKKIEQFNQKYNADFSYKKMSFSGMSTLTLFDIELKEKNAEPLLTANEITISVSFWKLLTGRISTQDISVNHCHVSMIRDEKRSNFLFLLKHRNEDKKTENQRLTISKTVERIIDLLFDAIPKSLNVDDFLLTYTNLKHNISIKIPSIKLANREFISNVIVTENNKERDIVIEGVLDKSNEEVSIKIHAPNHQKVEMPWVAYRNHATIQFDTISIQFKHNGLEQNKQVVSGLATVKKLTLFHNRIASDTVKIDQLSNDFILNFGDDYIEYDSSSTVTLNQLTLHPYLYYRPKPSKLITMSLNKSWFKASELFNSLPNGLFTNFNGMEVSGELSYHGYLNVDLEIPDSMIFESNLMQKNFKVTKYGDTDFRLLNDPFIHQVFENDEMVKEIILGPENRDFRSFEQIPVSLKNSILMSEDGWFFEHGGFSIGAFRESIITNIKTKRFTRGGSTISMQLVKNLFLSRKKNIARKAEELLIVWLIEGQRIISKERMFEIYVNIIEWGPGIYGATEAARFYFNKDVSALTLAECIYLAAIIPSPKNFRYLFNEDGTFREYILNNYALVVKRMVEHEKITQEEADAVVPKVLLTGEAKEIPIKKEKTKK